MSLYINTNMSAAVAHNAMYSADQAESHAMEQLSTGLRINRAADDASGLVIAAKLESQSDGIKVAIRNAQDGIGVVQTADGALNEVTNILQRMRDLAMHSANGATDTNGVAADQAENDQLVQEIDRIASTTKFGATNLLDGTFAKTFNVGATAAGGDLVDVSIDSGTAGTGFDSTSLGVNALVFANATSGTADPNVTAIDAAIDKVTASRAKLGAVQNRFTHTVNNLTVTAQNLDASRSRITDTDMAATMVQFSKEQILSQASQSMLSQANHDQQNILQLLRG